MSSPSVASVLHAHQLTEPVSARALEQLDDVVVEQLVDACMAEARDDALTARLARLAPEHFAPHLDALDPAGPLAPAFDGAPWARVKHWVTELDSHRDGIPSLDEGRPADALAAALAVLGRSACPQAYQRIERWLTWATEEQVAAAEAVLCTVGVGIAPGRRAMEVWRRPAWRLRPDARASDALRADATVLERGCTRCSEPFVCALDLDAESITDLLVPSPRLMAAVCVRCLLDGRPSLVTLGADGPACAAALLDDASARAEIGPNGAPSVAQLRLPALGPLTPEAAALHDDPERADRQALLRLGGAPTAQAPLGPVRSAKSGAPMRFVAQVPLDEAILTLWYTSEDRLLTGRLTT